MERKLVSYRLSAGLLYKVRKYGSKRNLTDTQIIEAALREYLKLTCSECGSPLVGEDE